jgi:hypothetical protein
MSGLLGGWWGVGGVALAAAFLAREMFKYLRGEVSLSARQKVVRVLGGFFLMAVLLMVVFSPVVLVRWPGVSRSAFNLVQLAYWGVALAMAVLMLLMAVMDLGEVSRECTRGRREIRSRSLKREDIDRLLAEHGMKADEDGDDGNGSRPQE